MEFKLPIVKQTHLQHKEATKADIEFFQVDVKSEIVLPVTTVQNQLLDSATYILINNAQKKIFLWNGKKSTSKARLTGTILAQQIRQDKGLTYRIEGIDQKHETPEFDTTYAIITDPLNIILGLVTNCFTKVKRRRMKQSLLKTLSEDYKKYLSKTKSTPIPPQQFEQTVMKALQVLQDKELISDEGTYYSKTDDWDQLFADPSKQK